MQNMDFVLKLITAYARLFSLKFTSDGSGDLINGFLSGDPGSTLVITATFLLIYLRIYELQGFTLYFVKKNK